MFQMIKPEQFIDLNRQTKNERHRQVALILWIYLLDFFSIFDIVLMAILKSIDSEISEAFSRGYFVFLDHCDNICVVEPYGATVRCRLRDCHSELRGSIPLGSTPKTTLTGGFSLRKKSYFPIMFACI